MLSNMHPPPPPSRPSTFCWNTWSNQYIWAEQAWQANFSQGQLLCVQQSGCLKQKGEGAQPKLITGPQTC